MVSVGGAIFGLVAGTAFILLGRWIYSNPSTLYVSSLYTSPDSPVRKFWARLFATFLIFGGSYTVTVVLWSGLLMLGQNKATMILTLCGGVLGSWLLRPRATDSLSAAGEPPAPRSGPGGNRLTRKGKFFVATILGGGILVTAEILLLFWFGKPTLWPDVALVTTLVTAVTMLCEMLFLK